jgi:RimJ/RimL family protein N-acetyltransferase
MSALVPTTDGVVVLRAPQPGDADTLIAGRDDEFHRWLGPGSAQPQPTACIVVDDEIVGWVDYDTELDRLGPGEVNVGYNVFAQHRGAGHGTRAVQLLMHHLAVRTDRHTATLLIKPGNDRSLALAERARFVAEPDVDGDRFFTRPIPPITYSDAVVTIRPPRTDDLEADLGAKDDEQIHWMWIPGEREAWEAMSPSAQRAHARRGLQTRHDAFGTGPKWTFSVDARDAGCVAYVDCDLANQHVPNGEANVAYSTHPAFRGKGYASRAVRLLQQFLVDHTAAPHAHLLIDIDNVASLGVARAVGATERECWIDDRGRTMVRHVLDLRG